jgi:hypothetical protein
MALNKQFLKKFGIGSRSKYLDDSWYAFTHGLANAKAARSHYETIGRPNYQAPMAGLKAPESTQLARWGTEFLLRLGEELGACGEGELNASDRVALRPSQINNRGKKRIAVVTAIFGQIDRLLPFDSDWAENADFFLFSDQKFENYLGWQPIHANYYNRDPRRRARFIKSHLPTYFSEYEWVLWLDGNILLCVDPSELPSKFGMEEFEFATFKHSTRFNIVSEAAACEVFGKDSLEDIVAHTAAISDHPAFSGQVLFETMVMMLRPGNQAVRHMCGHWWRYMVAGSKRDQLSLPLAVSDAAGLRWRYFPDQNIRTSSEFFWGAHK